MSGLRRFGGRVWRARRWLLLGLVLLWFCWRGLRVYAGAPELAAEWSQSSRVLARDGRLLGERGSAEALRGRHLPLTQISPRLVQATIASEDHDFYQHDGVDRVALVRAALGNLLRARVISGGSTITAQLVKRLDHHGQPHRRTFAIKLWELMRAQNLEAQVSKSRILETYLDVLDYGHGLAGPEAAAQAYFGQSARDVSLAQAALLAVLPRAPSALDPYRHRDRAINRQRALLHDMRRRGMIDADALRRALDEPLLFAKAPRTPRMLAPHLVLAAASERSGDIQTTLDLDLQHDVEAAVASTMPPLREKHASNACVLVIDNTTGEVLAEVGSAGYFDQHIAGAVDLVRRRRQAGSTLKPFVYALAFEGGMSPMQVLADVPTELGTTGAVYAPDNFDGSFSGPIAAREALAGSLNVPAVRLSQRLGVERVLDVLQRAGFALVGGKERFGLSIALGSGEVSPLEMAGAYAMLARGGERVRITDRPAELSTTRVLDPLAAAQIAEILSDPVALVRGVNARAALEFDYPVALKTGTSTGHRDTWTAGFTRERTVVVWIGNADGSATLGLTGASAAAPLFVEVMKRAMRNLPRAPLVAQDDFEEHEVCALSGERPSTACTDVVSRRFARGHAPQDACTMHRHAERRTAPAGLPPFSCTPHGSQTVVALPEEYARYLGERPLGAPGRDPHGVPWFLASQLPGCEAEEQAGGARIVVLEPRTGSVHPLEDDHDNPGDKRHDRLKVVIETHGLPRGVPLDVVVDGAVVGHVDQGTETSVPLTVGEHDLDVRPRDAHLRVRVGHTRFVAR